uniref:FH2 domain-containing protein n=1 Tax=Zea mays TaxID=4577 RepID=A0A804QDJ8_MAIZE
MTRGTEVVVRALLVAAAVAGLLLSAAAEDGVVIQRRSLHQPFFPVDPTPPPGFDDSIVPPPPPPAAAAGAAAASAASKGGGRSVTNAVAIALATGLVVLAVAFYSCFLLWRRRSDGGGGGVGGDGLRAVKSSRPGAVAVRVASDVGSSARHQRSPPPSSTASDAIYLDPLTTMVEVSRHRPQSPDLRPLALVKQPSPDLRPLPPLKRPAPQPPPPPASTPPMTTTTGDSSDEEDQATYYTAPKTAKSSFSRSTSQRSTVEPTVAQPPAPAPASTPTPLPPQANAPRPGRPPPPPPPPRQRLLRPMPEESPPPAVLASLALTNPPEPSGQDRGGENPDGHGGRARPPKPPSLKPLHWDKLRAISGRTTVWDQVNNSDSFRVDEAAIESLFLNNSGGVGNSDQAARRGGAGKQESRLLDPKRLQNVAIMLKVLNVTSSDVIGALMHGNGDLGSEFYETLAKMAPTKEEELKLKDAMLYRANFGAEVNYLKKSFGTLEKIFRQLVQI